MWVWAGAYTHMEGIGCPNLSLFDLLSWEKISHWAWGQASNQQAPGTLIFCPLQCWSIHSHAQLFSWILGIQTQVFMLLKQNALTHWATWEPVFYFFFLSFDFPCVMDNPLIPEICMDFHIMKLMRVQFMLFCFHWKKIYFLTPSVFE